jgi:hypothetical protein
MSISESQLNQNLQKSFPIEKEYAFIKLKLTNPKVKLVGEDRAKVSFNYFLQSPLLKGKSGKVEAEAKVEYDPNDKVIYLTDLIPEKLKGKVEGELLSSALRKVGRIPLYKFKGTKAQMVKDISIERNRILVKFGIY